MAKKKNETNAAPMEQELIAVNNPLAETGVIKDPKIPSITFTGTGVIKDLGTQSTTFEEKSYERDLNFLSIKELVYIEQATKIVCQKYENTVKNYDGSFKQNGDDYNNFKKFNTLRNKVISKLEEKLARLI